MKLPSAIVGLGCLLLALACSSSNALTAALGCVPMGIGSTIAIVLAVIMGTVVGLLPRPAGAT